MHVSSICPQARRTRIALGLVLLCASCALAVTAAASGAARTAGAGRTLVLIRRDPATVRGTGFRSRSHVRVVLVAQRSYVRRLLTNRHGTFTATFPTPIDRCTPWMVTALQRAAAPVVVHGARPECAPASTP